MPCGAFHIFRSIGIFHILALAAQLVPRRPATWLVDPPQSPALMLEADRDPPAGGDDIDEFLRQHGVLPEVLPDGGLASYDAIVADDLLDHLAIQVDDGLPDERAPVNKKRLRKDELAANAREAKSKKMAKKLREDITLACFRQARSLSLCLGASGRSAAGGWSARPLGCDVRVHTRVL